MAGRKGIDKAKIWQLHEAGYKPGQIASKLGLHRNTVRYHLDRLIKNGGSVTSSK